MTRAPAMSVLLAPKIFVAAWLAGFVLAGIAAAGGAKDIAREMTFGQQGTEDGEFKFPIAVALTPEKDIYVADSKKDTVSRFNQFGKFLRRIAPGTGAFEGPVGVAVDPKGNLFVVEDRKGQVRKFEPGGKEIAIIGRTGAASGEFGGPRGIACDSRGHIYIADYYNSRIQELDNDGRFVGSYVFQLAGGQAQQPKGVGVDGHDRVYGVYGAAGRVVRFGANGEPEMAFGAPGKAPGMLNDPHAIAFDSRNGIYVSDFKNNRLQKFNEQGQVLTSIGGRGSAQGQFRGPEGIAVDAEGNIYVADAENFRVQILVVSDFRRNLNLGLWFFRNLDYARSAFHYEEVLRADPNNKEAMESLVLSYRTLSDRAMRLNDVSEAKKYLAGILKLRPGNSDARRKLRSLVWEENRSDIYYPTLTLFIVLAGVFLMSVFFRFIKS